MSDSSVAETTSKASQEFQPLATREDDEDIEDEEGEEVDGQQGEGQASSEDKQKKKKKKSKAAAKLRKKLGMASKEDDAAVTTFATNGQTNEAETSSGPLLTDEEVNQLQQAILKEQGPIAANKADRATLEKLMKMMNLEKANLIKDQNAKQKQHKAIADHKFWKTQPVSRPDDPIRSPAEEGPIQPNQPAHLVRQEPYPLPNDFEWATIDIDNEEQLKEVYDLLSSNYVEDVDSTLRFNYSPEFIHWVLKHPGYNKKWHIGVRVTSTKKLVAFISGIPHDLRVREQSYHSSEVNFMCVHKKLRSKRLAPVLIKEVTRQCHLTGIFQGIHTAGAVIPTPISCARYYHRTLNAKKLVEVGFSAVPQGMSKELYFARYNVPKDTLIKGLREMEQRDVPQVGKLMRRYMRRFDMAARFSDAEVKHLLLSGRGTGSSQKGRRSKQVTWAYVVEDPTSGAITDMISFYSLPSSVLDSDKHKTLEAAYLFYYATNVPFTGRTDASSSSTASSSSSASTSTPPKQQSYEKEGLEAWQRSHITHLSPIEQEDEMNVINWASESPDIKAKLKTRLNELVQDAIIIAKQADFDVLNCMTVMDNPLFTNEQKFGPGDGFLRFYLFNWRIVPIAGGMGARAGEAELDPVVDYLKVAISSGGGKMSDADLNTLSQKRPRPEMGSGNGIVMV